MELAHDHPLCTVHHKGSLLGHQGEFPHVHAFLNRRTIVMQNEGHIKRRCIGHAFTETFDRSVLGLT